MERRTEWLIIAPVMALGFLLRLMHASSTYLNPDEIQYFFLALPGSVKELILGVARHTDHPPLLFLLLHPIASVTSSEIALRLIPVLAGTIFPWVMYRWLARVWNAGSGLAALAILTFSPNLISLSAQFRGYTLLLLFAALALLYLETALADRSLRAMILFSVSLDLAILSEYSAAWFASAAAIYFLLRAKECPVPPRLLAAWGLGQLSALAICGTLYWGSIRPRLATNQTSFDGFLRGAFPAAQQNLLAFSALATLKQFAYAFSSIALGIGSAILFSAALVLLWKGGSAGQRMRNRILAALLVTPFLLACAGALLRLHPYGRTRHTVILSLFVAAGVAIPLEKIFRSRRWLIGVTTLSLVLVWMVAEPDQNDIAPSRAHRTSMIAAIHYLQSAIPPGSIVLAEQETARYIRFYLPHPRDLRLQADFDSPDGVACGFRLIYRRWDFGEVDGFLADLASVRHDLGLQPDAPVWIIDGGFDNAIAWRLRKRFPGVSLPDLHDFDGALTVFQVPPGI